MESTTSLQHRASSIQQDRRAALRVALAAALAPVAACQTAPSVQTECAFPVVGRRLLVTFPAFRTELHFHSTSSLTWHLLNSDGTNGRSETVEIRIQPVVDKVFLVTWQEANKTTVVQVEDFERKVILTNVTRSDGTFLQSKGTFVEMSGT
jgi:hypothetical protein